MHEGDERLASITIKSDSCIQKENLALEKCLQENNKDWRYCQVQIKALQKCYESKKLNISENNN